MTNFKKIVAAVAILPLAVITTLAGPAKVSAADNAYFSLSGTGSYVQGGTITATVRINGGDPAVSFQANLTYDAAKLECTDVVAGGSFPQWYDVSCGGGSVIISATTRNRAVVPAPSTAGTITFKALASSGSATVSFVNTDGTGIYHGVDGHNMIAAGASTGATYAFTAPGKGAEQPANPGPSAPAPNKPAPTTNTSPVNGTTRTATAEGSVAGQETTNSATTQTEDSKKSDAAESDDNKQSDDSKDTNNTNSLGWWFWILAAVAIAAGIVTGRRVQAARVAKATQAAAAAAAAKPAKKAAKNAKK